jgi:hypothetical protein
LHLSPPRRKQTSLWTEIAASPGTSKTGERTRGLENIVTLIEVINLCREDLADESIGVRRSWEDLFRYTLKHYPERTAFGQFNPNDLEKRLLASGVNRAIVNGYVMRWREVIERHRSRAAE